MLEKFSSSSFQNFVLNFYYRYGRHALPWRHTTDPYNIIVSEIMLQQTQVDRVIPKYENFLQHFPSALQLASVSFPEVLAQWVGLGYNRRAKFLHQAATAITALSEFPQTYNELIKLPGIGDYTAKAVLTFAFNQPHIIIETNIRTVFLYHFFPEQQGVHDSQLLPLISQTLHQENPRLWYWALMDYGSFLKTTIGNLSRQSRHYTKQSKFHGSDRQIRARIVSSLVEGKLHITEVFTLFPREKSERMQKIINSLIADKMIIAEKDTLMVYYEK